MRRLGVLGTMVWDRIYARDIRSDPVEEWGGIAYALAAASAARPRGWQIVPIVRLGRDLEEEAYRYFRTLPGLDLESGVRVVPEPNNRVELRYQDRTRRCERMSGGVGAWSWDELAPIVHGLDALYINFISGFELDLETAQLLRLGYAGPIYADLHSIFLGIDADGQRELRPLAAWREWLRCFDAVQMNEEEFSMLAYAWGDPWKFAAETVGDELRLLLVTLGARGAAYVASSSFRADPGLWQERGPRGALTTPTIVRPAAVTSERVAAATSTVDGDPTGCGDVWGATCFCALLAGESLRAAVEAANTAASRNLAHRGAGGLHHHLSGRLGP
jgi:sugar/nucleoside kinase (ribokinase family)